MSVCSLCVLLILCSLIGLNGLPGFGGPDHRFPTFFWNRFLIGFWLFLAPFWAPLLMIFYVFCITFPSMDFALICHWFWYGFGSHFWWFFDDFPVRAFTSDETSRTLFLNNSIVFCAQNQGFTLSVKHEFSWFSWSFSIPVLALIFDAFWHRFWLHFGSLFASNFMFFGDGFLYSFLNGFFMENGSKREPKS